MTDRTLDTATPSTSRLRTRSPSGGRPRLKTAWPPPASDSAVSASADGTNPRTAGRVPGGTGGVGGGRASSRLVYFGGPPTAVSATGLAFRWPERP
eukprot:scaffold1794_cov390-Prasinococcus_capsulatus_cf.AAC.1